MTGCPSTTCGTARRRPRRRVVGTRRAVPLGGRAVDPGEEAAAGADAVDRRHRRRAPSPRLERARHADAVLVLGEARRTRRPPGTDARPGGSTRRPHRRGGGRARRGTAPATARPCRARRPPRPRVCAAGPARVVCTLTPSGTTPTVASRGNRSRMPSSVSSSTSPSFMPGHTTTWPCTSTPASSSAREPAQARRAAPVAQEPGAHLGVGRVDADVERAEPLGDDALEVGFGEAGQRGEVAVQERQPVVVVLQVEAAPHALRAAGR